MRLNAHACGDVRRSAATPSKARSLQDNLQEEQQL
jgi:hypothetical protein